LLGVVAEIEPVAERVRFVERLSAPMQRCLNHFWPGWAHRGQMPPPQFLSGAGGCAVWLMVTGRGFGKTRAGAEWVWALARKFGDARIALVGATIEDVRQVMIEGESGLLATARTGETVRYARTDAILRFPSGAEAFAYSGCCPDKLRGPQHHFAWCDEIAKWRHPDATWDNLQLGLRLGESPKALVTTTPKSVPLVRRLAAAGDVAKTRGRTADNLNLPDAYLARMEGEYRGTRKGREELDGEIILEAEGALWSHDLLARGRSPSFLPAISRGGGPAQPVEGPLHHGQVDSAPHCPAMSGGHRDLFISGGPHHRVGHAPHDQGSSWRRSDPMILQMQGRIELKRIVIGVDPPASAQGDACGIVACGLGSDGVGYVLGDHSERGLSPEGWAAKVVEAAGFWGADCVIVEKNQGGDMVTSVLKTADPALPVRPVHARYGKGDRAEPVAMLFESGIARLAGCFPELEDELCAMTRGGGWAGPGRSPDRADAMVWALTELMLGKPKAEPRIRRL
ncbi:MAG: DNA-packaging protein, partial [Sphingosinicella sp.]|uniref:DNA-packaging protein n=1 Tax=Sphingosinicella sp. TaxID=1917971 RepID=UPI004037BB71